MSKKIRGGRFSSEYVAALLSKVNPQEVVNSFVPLKFVNEKYSYGICPLHSENTASFSYSMQADICYCFGCGIYSSTVIWFLCEIFRMRDRSSIQDKDFFSVGRSWINRERYWLKAVCWLARKYRYWPNDFKKEQKNHGRTG